MEPKQKAEHNQAIEKAFMDMLYTCSVPPFFGFEVPS